MTQLPPESQRGQDWAVLSGVGLAVIGPFLPWYEVGSGAFRRSRSGLSIGDGTWVIVAAGFAGVIAIATLNQAISRGVRLSLILAGSLALLVALYDLGHLAAQPGEWVTAAGAALILGGTLSRAQP